MPSQLDVVNQALNEQGFPPVTSINDQAASQLIAAKLNILLPELLLRTDWNFAIKYRTDNTPLTVPVSPDFPYCYELPPDYNRMDRFSRVTTGSTFGFYYRILDGMICTNIRPINYYYVVSNADYSVLPPLFYRVLALYAAAETANVNTNNVSLQAELERKYLAKLQDAIRQNDMDRYVASAPYNDFQRQVYI